VNWSKTNLATFENEFRKQKFTDKFFIKSTTDVINEKSLDLFSQVHNAALVSTLLLVRFH